MNKPLTARDYHRRIDLVIAHIGAHLDDPLDLDALAAVACFSPYHFHRIYRSVMGETAAETMRRLRLHRASGEIIQSTTPVARIARRAGYGSVAAFTRAFTSAYGVAAGAVPPAGAIDRAAHRRRCPGDRHVPRHDRDLALLSTS